MNHEQPRVIELKGSNSTVTYAWIAGILIVVVGSLFGLLVQSALATQATQQAQINANSQNIQALQSEYVKQTALLVVVAEKVGVPSSEVNQLLNTSLSTN